MLRIGWLGHFGRDDNHSQPSSVGLDLQPIPDTMQPLSTKNEDRSRSRAFLRGNLRAGILRDWDLCRTGRPFLHSRRQPPERGGDLDPYQRADPQ